MTTNEDRLKALEQEIADLEARLESAYYEREELGWEPKDVNMEEIVTEIAPNGLLTAIVKHYGKQVASIELGHTWKEKDEA